MDKADILSTLSYSLKGGADFAELFFEDRDTLSITYSDGVLGDIGKKHIFGVGLYMLRGTRSVYVYGNRTDKASLLTLADKATALLEAAGCSSAKAAPFRIQPPLREPNPVNITLSTVDHAKKLALLSESNSAARAASPCVRSVATSYFDDDQRVTIANSEGVFVTDRRSATRIRTKPLLERGADSLSYFSDFVKPTGFEAYSSDEYIKSAVDTVKQMEETLLAEDAPSGVFPVILSGGSCTGTFFHEACGHQFETTELARGGIFWDKRGERVASEKVTLIDDGTLPDMYGSSIYDDEGMPRQKKTLIENGIMKEVMADRFGSRKLGVEMNGSGRRQNYTYAPGARMSNTYLVPGHDSAEDIIRSTQEGLYITGVGGGYGGAEFSVAASNAWWIKDGRLDHPVKGASVLGRGNIALMNVDMVSKDMLWDEGGDFCGSDSGFIHVTGSGPVVRVSKMLIGGKGSE